MKKEGEMRPTDQVRGKEWESVSLPSLWHFLDRSPEDIGQKLQ